MNDVRIILTHPELLWPLTIGFGLIAYAGIGLFGLWWDGRKR